MTPEERFERIETILAAMAKHHAEAGRDIDRRLSEMAARQQYHDEALERLDAAVKANTEGLAKLETHMAKLTDTMDRLATIVIRHAERLDDLEGNATT
jgi:predicted nuclease with TOPRIM domain